MQHLSDFDSYVLNESISYKDLINKIKATFNSSLSYLELRYKIQIVLKYIKSLPKKQKTLIMTSLIASLLTFKTSEQILELAKQIKDIDFLTLIKSENEEAPKYSMPFYDVDELTISNKGMDFLKELETLRLDAYDIKDGKITIGWGHAEDKATSKYKLGDKITKQEADRLFEKDINNFEKSIKKRFMSWPKKIELTQDMWDALVSIAYHKGVDGMFSDTKFMKYLKKGDYQTAGELIRHEYDKKAVKRFPGWITRRAKESEMFLSYLGGVR